jgi:hypothetical protein
LFGEAIEYIFLPFLPISSIVFLEVSFEGFFLSTSCWLTIFGSIPTLESIRLCTVGPMFFFYALRPDSSNAQVVPFKALKYISLFAFITLNDYQVLVDILRERLEHGVRLLEFVFPILSSPPPYEALSQLMEVVPFVGVYQSSHNQSLIEQFDGI